MFSNVLYMLALKTRIGMFRQKVLASSMPRSLMLKFYTKPFASMHHWVIVFSNLSAVAGHLSIPIPTFAMFHPQWIKSMQFERNVQNGCIESIHSGFFKRGYRHLFQRTVQPYSYRICMGGKSFDFSKSNDIPSLTLKGSLGIADQTGLF